MFLCSKDFLGEKFSFHFHNILVIGNIVFIMSFKASKVLNSLKNYFDGAKRNVPVDSIAAWLDREIDNPSVSNEFIPIRKINFIAELVEEDQFQYNIGMNIACGLNSANVENIEVDDEDYFMEQYDNVEDQSVSNGNGNMDLSNNHGISDDPRLDNIDLVIDNIFVPANVIDPVIIWVVKGLMYRVDKEIHPRRIHRSKEDIAIKNLLKCPLLPICGPRCVSNCKSNFLSDLHRSHVNRIYWCKSFDERRLWMDGHITVNPTKSLAKKKSITCSYYLPTERG